MLHLWLCCWKLRHTKHVCMGACLSKIQQICRALDLIYHLRAGQIHHVDACRPDTKYPKDLSESASSPISRPASQPPREGVPHARPARTDVVQYLVESTAAPPPAPTTSISKIKRSNPHSTHSHNTDISTRTLARSHTNPAAAPHLFATTPGLR